MVINKYQKNVPSDCSLIGVANIDNGCCESEPVLITAKRWPDGSVYYSCQCACGGWVTTGYLSRSKAINEYKRMNRFRRRGGKHGK